MFSGTSQCISTDLKCVYAEIQKRICTSQWSLTYTLMLLEVCVVRDTTRLEREQEKKRRRERESIRGGVHCPKLQHLSLSPDTEKILCSHSSPLNPCDSLPNLKLPSC